MRYSVISSIPGRVRLDLHGKIPEAHAVAIEELLGKQCFVAKCVVYPRIGAVAVCYQATATLSLDQARQALLREVGQMQRAQIERWKPEDSLALAPRPRHLFSVLANMTLWHFCRSMFLPQPVKMVLRALHAVPFFRAAWASLRAHRLDVPVLDAAAIAMGFMQGNGASAGRSMYLLHVSDALEDYTQRRSESSLAQSLMAIPTAARKLEGDLEIEIPLDQLQQGDVVVARLGDSVPVDGKVISGQAAVNQSSLTGEPLAIMRTQGDTVYAGTVVEDGEICILVTGDPQASKIRSIVALMEQSEAMKSATQKRIENMADKLVPWNFLLAGVVALTTRSLSKTAAALMVDYSCALKLSGSIAVMAAQRESAKHGFIVKGSRYFEAMAEADVIVFDKTGTLTAAEPSVCRVESYCEETTDEILRLAACFEEHFPHPVARAVVNAALEKDLEHRERHAEVEYIIAHGIASSIDGKRAVIGSEHFVLEDEHIAVSDEVLEKIHATANGASPLLMAVDGVLAGVIYIEDPLKPGTKEVVNQLRAEGFKRIIMLTGDNESAAQKAAEAAGVDEFRANLLPEDKHALVSKLQEEGYKVAMIGDGVNDAPALAAAHVSIAMSGGSAVAREAADISLVSDNLGALVELRKLCRALQARMAAGYRFTIGFNSLLLALGIGGVISPQASSAAHNGSTIALSALNARPYLPAETSKDAN